MSTAEPARGEHAPPSDPPPGPPSVAWPSRAGGTGPDASGRRASRTAESSREIRVSAPRDVADTAEVTFLDAIAEALAEEMEADPGVVVLGEDVAVYGGAFKVTKGFLERFGPGRVIDFPIGENAIVGAAVGMAIQGMRPVAEMQYMDFIVNGFDQLTMEAAKMHYRTGVAVPLVVRGPVGGGVRAGPFHSINPEAWFAHTPGLKVVEPSTAYEAKGLLKAAIRDDNPVLFLEHKLLYRRVKDRLPRNDYIVPVGVADVKRVGADVTIVTYGAMVWTALRAAGDLAAEGIDCEVVDLRSLYPLDEETVLTSVERTSRALVLQETNAFASISSEVAALVGEKAFGHLDAPVRRLTAPHAPHPFSPPLEDAWIPQVADVVAAVRDLARY